MTELSLETALEVLNTAKTYLSSSAVEIFISGNNLCVDVECLADRPEGALGNYIGTVEAAAEVVSGAMGEGGKFFLTVDNRGRWVLIPNS